MLLRHGRTADNASGRIQGQLDTPLDEHGRAQAAAVAPVLAALAPRYRNPEVGTITFSDRGGAKWMKAGFVEGPVATRKNLDGSISIVSAGAGAIGVEALIGSQAGTRTLTIRDSQHEYVYTEVR